MSEIESCILLLADGARCDVFERLLAAGELPHIQQHIVERGTLARATTAFASTSGPAYLPFLVGAFPGTANVPGIRWLDKRAVHSKPIWNRNRYRSYCGPQARYLSRDIAPELKTLFEQVSHPVNVFGPVTRGLSGAQHRRPRTKWLLWIRSHYDATYERVDAFGGRLVRAAIADGPSLIFTIFPGIDGLSHHFHPEHERVIAAYRHIDDTVGKVVQELYASGAYERTAIGICSDHGLSKTQAHFDVAAAVRKYGKLRTSTHPLMWKVGMRASVHVSGNSMAHVYFKNHDWGARCSSDDVQRIAPGLLPELLASDAVDVLLLRAGGSNPENAIEIRSRRGRAVTWEASGRFHYEPLGEDPFGYPTLPRVLDQESALRLTFDTQYPDAIVQSVQIFRSQRCGDMVVTAAPGYDLRGKWEQPEHHGSHGSLHREHMMTPFAFSRPLASQQIRTADVYATILDTLDVPWHDTGDCVSRAGAREHELSAV